MFTRTLSRRPQPSPPSAAPSFAVQRFSASGLEQEAEAPGLERMRHGFVPALPPPASSPQIPRYGALGSRILRQELAWQPATRSGPGPGEEDLPEPGDEAVRSAAAEGVRTPAVVLPHLDRIQASFGHHPVGQVKAHVGAGATQAARAMNARAFASGDHVVFGSTPNLRTAAHEAAHVLQQRAGVDLPSGVGAPGDRYERHADAVADRVVHGQSAEALLLSLAGSPGAAASRPPSGAPAVQMAPPRERRAKRGRMSTIDSEEERRRREEGVKRRSETQREKTVWQSRELHPPEGEPTTAQEMERVTTTPSAFSTPFVFESPNESIRRQVDLEIQDAIEESSDTLRLDEFLQQIKAERDLESITLEGLGTSSPKVRYTFNPTYEVLLSGTDKLALRMLGTDPTNKYRTNVKFAPSKLTLPTSPALTTEVGHQMLAYPLSQDHEPGSEAGKDKKQSPMMAELRGAGNTSLSNPNKYIKGHLLNDNVGGPAIPSNLFPITAEANAKHLAWVEKFVKADIQKGYVLLYKVDVEPDPATITPVKVSTSPAGYQVDAAFKCEFYRLDQTGQPISASKTAIEVPSKYGMSQKGTFDVKKEPAYQGRYSALNESKSTPTAKSVWPSEATYSPSGGYTLSNLGGAVTENVVTSFSPSLPSFGTTVTSTPPSITIDSSKVPATKLSLQNSSLKDLADAWEAVASGWKRTDIENWINALKVLKPRRWAAVKVEAVKNGFSPTTVADNLFDDATAVGRQVMKLG